MRIHLQGLPLLYLLFRFHCPEEGYCISFAACFFMFKLVYQSRLSQDTHWSLNEWCYHPCSPKSRTPVINPSKTQTKTKSRDSYCAPTSCQAYSSAGHWFPCILSSLVSYTPVVETGRHKNDASDFFHTLCASSWLWWSLAVPFLL